MASQQLGNYLTLADFCTCTRTYDDFKDSIDPWPQQPASIKALEALAIQILDPIIAEYGRSRFVMTYGFCSKDLKRLLTQKDAVTGRKRGRIAPSRDQHMALERDRNGNLYCLRQGAACDFYIHGCPADRVVRWILTQDLPFDSIYFYGAMRPLHISHGPEQKRALWAFTNRGTPKRWQPEI